MTFSRTDSSTSAQLATMPLVLMYHSVTPYDEDPYEVTVTPERFGQQLRWIRDRGLRGVSMAELLAAHAEGRPHGLVALTFDDGYQDFITGAMPALERFGFTATIFVLAGRLGGHNGWDRPGPDKALLTAAQVREVADAGMEIGSHGLDHLRLTQVDDAVLAAETASSRAVLERLLDNQIRGFCYPYGQVNGNVAEAVRVAGYDYACAVGPSAVIGRHAIPRTYVHDRDIPWRLDAKRIVFGVTVGNRLAVRHHRRSA